MLDFKKKLTAPGKQKKINPVETYDSLDRRSDAGPLRPAQKRILDKWFSERLDQKDVILKLHTGQGKTLIGLLILQSTINQGKGPALYICPNKHLALQSAHQATKFGVPHILFDEDQDLPSDFLEGNKILITHVQKVFHGFTKFGLNRQSVKTGAVVLDDSHACIDSIKNAFTLNIDHSEDAYKDLIELFEEDIKAQGLGTYQEIRQGEYDSILPVPYWAWIDKSENVLSILSKYRTQNCIKFQWPLLKDALKSCQCVVSGHKVEIVPYINPIRQFGTFSDAKQRILMSATTLDDSFFVKGLSLNTFDIQNPLKDEKEKWSGEKIILIPSLIDEALDRIKIINEFAVPSSRRKFGQVILVPSFKRTEIYSKQGCSIATSKTIQDEVEKLTKGDFEKPLVITNRYDGIDLPDDTCRVLIIDSKPFSENLTDLYEELCRPQSDLINVRLAQKIEQGLGRSVRGEKDYSVILLLGGPLTNFVRSSQSLKYLSEQTIKQIEIGIEVAAMTSDALGEVSDPLAALNAVIKQCIITRDDGWKEYYKAEMDKIVKTDKTPEVLALLDLEKQAEEAHLIGEHQKAKQIIQHLIDEHVTQASERAWYIQMMARFEYEESKVESNKLQISAYKQNLTLLKPTRGITYEKLGFISGNRTSNIRAWITSYLNFNELWLKVGEIFDRLSFGEDSEKFESSLNDLGLALGFECQRPDKEIKQGPDNLWCIAKNEYILFECKNQVKETRSEINKLETGQMNNSCGWFEKNYPGMTVKPIIIIPTKNVTASGAFLYDVDIMRKGKLNLLKKNVKSFFKEFSKYDLRALTDEQIQLYLETHKLDIKSLKHDYSEKHFQQR